MQWKASQDSYRAIIKTKSDRLLLKMEAVLGVCMERKPEENHTALSLKPTNVERMT